MNNDSNTRTESTIRRSNESNRSIRNNFGTENVNNRITGIIDDDNPLNISDNFTTRNADNTIELIRTRDGRQIVINHNIQIDNVSISRPSTNSVASSLTGRVISPGDVGSTTGLNRNQSTSNILNQNNTQSSKLRKMNSLMELKHRIGKLFITNKTPKLTSKDFPINDQTIFKISEIKIEELLLPTYRLKNFMVDNSIFFYNTDILKSLNSIINDLELFINIQKTFIEMINDNNYSDHIAQILYENDYCSREYEFAKNETYNNNFNIKLFNILNNYNLIDNLTLNKLKEFYVINDLDYLDYKNKKIIFINFYDKYILFKIYYDENFEKLRLCPQFDGSMKIERLAYLYRKFIWKFNSFMESNFKPETLDNIERKNYDTKIKYKEIDRLRKTRIIAYYDYLFKHYKK
jgi:hypothetical protein